MDSQSPARIQPPVTDTARAHFEGARRGELRLQQCTDCERFQFYPRIVCSHCGSKRLTWQVASGRGRIASYTVVRRGISPAYPAPYVVALIDLEEGPRMMSNLIDCEPEAVSVGAVVEVRFEPWGAECVLPVFVLRE